MKRHGPRGVRRRRKTVLLPWELIIKILLRLPVKSLVRFKCVCKSWLSLISDPHFAKSHFEVAAALTKRVLFLEFSAAPVIRSIDLNASLHDDSASAALNVHFLLPEPTAENIIGSCRGFVVLDCYHSLWVWNPSTGVHKQVSCSPIASDMDARFFTFSYGFGYDSSTDDYLIVQMSYDTNSNDYVTRVEIFSLRANAWKEIEGIHLSYMNCCDDIKVGSFLNGAIHWPAFRCDVSKDVIVSFDLVERSFSEIPLPVDFYCEFNYCDLGVVGEFLSLCIEGLSDPAEIWVMKEYKVQSSWTKTIVVSVDHIPSQYFSLICSTESGDIVGSDGRDGLAKCNSEGQLQEHRSYSNGSNGHRVTVYTESLLSLPCADEASSS